MTGLLRTSLLFFLPVFLLLAVYQIWLSSRLSPTEQREMFREENAATLDLVREEVEKLLVNHETGKITMSEVLAENGVFLALVNDSTGPVLSLLPPSLMDSKTWSLVPDPKPSPSYMASHQYLIHAASDAPAVPVVLCEETIYEPDGDPAQLNVYLERKSLTGDE